MNLKKKLKVDIYSQTLWWTKGIKNSKEKWSALIITSEISKDESLGQNAVKQREKNKADSIRSKFKTVK